MQKYRLGEQIGQGGFSITWLAYDRKQSAKQKAAYIVKELCLDKIEDWKAVEQFEREARVLSHLNHPHIPAFVDFVEEEQAGGKRLFLVQALIEGQDLESLIQAGKYFTEQEVQAIARTLTEVLVYLQSFSPAIVHRDIKPGNIMLRAADQHVYLIDFGAVKAPEQTDSEQGLTVTGTFGYMPIEQIEGRALPASDIYGLGMSLIYLLSHTEPNRLPKQGLILDFRPYVNISEGFARVIDKMIAPDVKKRYAHAADLLTDLQDLQTQSPASTFTRKHWKLTAAALVLFGLTGFAAVRELTTPESSPQVTPVQEASPALAKTPALTTTAEYKQAADGHYYREEWRQAVPAYQLYLKAKADDTEALFRLGYSAGKQLDHATAVAAYQQLEKIAPNAQSNLFYNLGYNYYQLKKIPQATHYFKKMLATDAKHVGSLNYMGLIELEQKKFAAAKAYFDQVLAIDPTYKYSLNNYGELYKQQNQLPQALLYFQRAVASDPAYALPAYNQSEVYYMQKKYNDCLQAAGKAIEKSGVYASAYNQRGLCYRGLKQLDAAAQDFKIAIQQSPVYATAYYNLGLTYDDTEDLKQAEHFYQEALRVNPEHHRALNNLGYIYERQNKYQQALEQYDKALKVTPEAQYYDNRGGAYKQLKQCALAVADFKLACQKGRSSACEKTCS